MLGSCRVAVNTSRSMPKGNAMRVELPAEGNGGAEQAATAKNMPADTTATNERYNWDIWRLIVAKIVEVLWSVAEPP